jgi:hypothetical protein
MKNIFFIPFTEMAIIKFKQGKLLNVKFVRLENMGLWSLIIGRCMLISNYNSMSLYYEELKRLNDLEVQ